jgi:hypothetical protein
MRTQLRRVWPGLAIVVGLLAGSGLSLYAAAFGLVHWFGGAGCNGGSCDGAIAAGADHYKLLLAIGVIGGGALVITGGIAGYRRGKRTIAAADCRSGTAGPASGDPLATARLRRRSDRVVSK